jgi:hypothetical protein
MEGEMPEINFAPPERRVCVGVVSAHRHPRASPVLVSCYPANPSSLYCATIERPEPDVTGTERETLWRNENGGRAILSDRYVCRRTNEIQKQKAEINNWYMRKREKGRFPVFYSFNFFLTYRDSLRDTNMLYLHQHLVDTRLSNEANKRDGMLKEKSQISNRIGFLFFRWRITPNSLNSLSYTYFNDILLSFSYFRYSSSIDYTFR